MFIIGILFLAFILLIIICSDYSVKLPHKIEKIKLSIMPYGWFLKYLDGDDIKYQWYLTILIDDKPFGHSGMFSWTNKNNKLYPFGGYLPDIETKEQAEEKMKQIYNKLDKKDFSIDISYSWLKGVE